MDAYCLLNAATPPTTPSQLIPCHPSHICHTFGGHVPDLFCVPYVFMSGADVHMWQGTSLRCMSVSLKSRVGLQCKAEGLAGGLEMTLEDLDDQTPTNCLLVPHRYSHSLRVYPCSWVLSQSTHQSLTNRNVYMPPLVVDGTRD